MPDNLKSACALARRGLRVFRLAANAKGGSGNFVDADWVTSATANRLEAVERWTETPAANIGVLTTGLCVIDVDAKDDKGGLESFATLRANREWPETYTQKTPSGGLHVFFDAAGLDIRNSASKLAAGLDIRAHNGYVVGAGSTIDGRAYSVEIDAPIAPLPEWLRDAVLASQERHEAVAASTDEVDTPRLIDWARQALKAEAPAVQGAGGDNRTIEVANIAMDIGLSPAETFRQMAEHWNDRCTPPWSHDDLQRKVDSAARSRDNAIGCRNPFAGFEVVPVKPFDPATDCWFEQRVPEWNFTEEDADKFPARPWIIPGMLMRGVVSQIMAPGATGKTALEMQIAAAVALEDMRPISYTAPDGLSTYRLRERTNVLFINFEDAQDEIDRRAVAAFKYFGLNYRAAKGKVRVFSGTDGNRFKLCARDDKGRVVETPQVDLLIRYMLRHDIGLVILDPLVDLHEADENSNSEMRRVADALRKIASGANASVLIAHHTRKPPAASSEGYAGNMDAGRGASSISGAVRIALTMFGMTEKDAKALGINENERHKYARLDDAKQNLVLASPFARWFKKETVTIGIEGEGLGAFVPVALASRKEDPAPAIAKALLPALLGTQTHTMTITGAAIALSRDPFFADGSDSTRKRAIRNALEGRPVAVDGWVVTFEPIGETGGNLAVTKSEAGTIF